MSFLNSNVLSLLLGLCFPIGSSAIVAIEDSGTLGQGLTLFDPDDVSEILNGGSRFDHEVGELMFNTDSLSANFNGTSIGLGELGISDRFDVAVFAFEGLALGSGISLTISGSRPIALLSQTDFRLASPLIWNGARGSDGSDGMKGALDEDGEMGGSGTTGGAGGIVFLGAQSQLSIESVISVVGGTGGDGGNGGDGGFYDYVTNVPTGGRGGEPGFDGIGGLAGGVTLAAPRISFSSESAIYADGGVHGSGRGTRLYRNELLLR